MNNQFATQFLLQEDEFSSLEDHLFDLGADEDLIRKFMKAIRLGILSPEQAINIIKSTLNVNEDGGAAAAPAGGSTTGGGVTNGASFTPGAGEQYAAGTRKKRVKEDAPRLAGSPAKTNKQGAKNISTYTDDGFTKAPSAAEAGKHIKGVEVKELWEVGKENVGQDFVVVSKDGKKIEATYKGIRKDGEHVFAGASETIVVNPKDVQSRVRPLSESRAYSQFKKEAAMRSKPDQLHQAAKMVQNKLDEITKLLEFTSQMRSELSEGEENLEYKHNTKKVFEKINSKVVEVYSKVKNLK